MKKVKYNLEKDIRSKKILSSIFFGVLILIGMYFSSLSEDIADEAKDKAKIYKKNIIFDGRIYINNKGEFLEFKEFVSKNDTDEIMVKYITGNFISEKDNKNYTLKTKSGILNRNTNILRFNDKVFLKMKGSVDKIEINSLTIDRDKKIFKGEGGFYLVDEFTKLRGESFVIDDINQKQNFSGNIKIIYKK